MSGELKGASQHTTTGLFRTTSWSGESRLDRRGCPYQAVVLPLSKPSEKISMPLVKARQAGLKAASLAT